jgi:flagellar basal body-associated protein FliL
MNSAPAEPHDGAESHEPAAAAQPRRRRAMIKFVIAALWLVAVTLGTVIFSFSMTGPKADSAPQPAFFGGLDYVKTDIISVPLMKDEEVYGYFLTRLVYTVEPAVMKTLSLPAEALLVDEVYSYLYANPQIDFADYARLDLDKLRTGIRDAVNKRVGKKLVHDVLIEQIDFLTKAEIRDNTIRRRTPPENEEAAPAPVVH